MFSIYGVNGQLFRGSLEEVMRAPGVLRVRGARAVARDGVEFGVEPPAAGNPATDLAVGAYQAAQHEDLERGPLYRALQIMARDVIVLAAADKVDLAWRVLLENRIHQAPVLDAGQRLVGIVSERDLLTTLNVEKGMVRDVLARLVGDVMTSPVVSADPETDIRRIARIMLERDVDGVPIVDERQVLVGFVSRSDILGAVVTNPPLSLWR